MSLDVKSLFICIPLYLAITCTKTLITNTMHVLPLPTEDIMALLKLCLTSTYFRHISTRYKQLHRTGIGSPVSVVVAKIVVQTIEERALATTKHVLPFWFHYVDGTITALHADDIDDLHTHINKQDSHIQFTKDVEENVTLPYKSITTLRQVLTSIKNKKQPNERQGSVYKINCSDCHTSYFGETGRNLIIRLTKHKRAIKKRQN